MQPQTPGTGNPEMSRVGKTFLFFYSSIHELFPLNCIDLYSILMNFKTYIFKFPFRLFSVGFSDLPIFMVV